MTREIEIRLIGHGSPEGALLAADALGLIASFKDVTYRLTRAVADRPGLGRTDAILEKLATVQVALRPGSTRVVFVVGDEAALIDPVSQGVDDAFWSIVEGLQRNHRPKDISDTVADSVDNLVVALRKAAPEAEFTVPGHPTRRFRTATLSRDPWQRTAHDDAGETTLHGLLEMVDLRSSRFRLRDIAGNSVDLHDVVDAEHAAHLVGEQVTVTGALAVGRGTQHHRMDGATVEAAKSLEERFRISPAASVETLLSEARSHPVPPPMDISDEELAEFLADIRG